MKDRVIFKYSQGGIVAFLPDIPTNLGMIMSYMHIGQHGEASLGFYHECLKALPHEYKELADELTNIGYNLDIKQRLVRRRKHDNH